jgi:hypothetical protein
LQEGLKKKASPERGRFGGSRKALPAPLPDRRGLRTKSSEARMQNDTCHIFIIDPFVVWSGTECWVRQE